MGGELRRRAASVLFRDVPICDKSMCGHAIAAQVRTASPIDPPGDLRSGRNRSVLAVCISDATVSGSLHGYPFV